MLIIISANILRVEMVTMSPAMTKAKVILNTKASRLGVTESGLVTTGTDVVGAILLIVTQTMTLKVLNKRRTRSMWDRCSMGGGR